MEAPGKQLTRSKTAIFINMEICKSPPLIVFPIFGASILSGNGFVGNACIYGNSEDCILCLNTTRPHSTNVVITPLIVVFEWGAEAILLRVLLILLSNVRRESSKKKSSCVMKHWWRDQVSYQVCLQRVHCVWCQSKESNDACDYRLLEFRHS